MIVYWSKYLSEVSEVKKNNIERLSRGYDLTVNPPQSLYQYLISNYDLRNKLGNYVLCPAALNELKSTYYITSDINYHFYFENNEVKSDMYDQKMFDNVLQRENDTLFFFNFYTIMYSEVPCRVIQIPPYLHKTTFSRGNCLSVSASMDISKWFRPMHGVYMNDEKSPFQIQAMDPLYYVKFETQEKIEFKEFNMNQNLFDLSLNCTNYKKFHPRSGLKKLYNKFIERKYGKRIMKEIKENIV